MAHIDAEVTAFLVVVDARKISVSAALTNFVIVRPLLFPETASTTTPAAFSAITIPDYAQTFAPGTTLDNALAGLRANHDATNTAWGAFLTARNVLTTPPYNQTNTDTMLAALLTANTGTTSVTTGLANAKNVRPLLLADYANAIPLDNLTQVALAVSTLSSGGNAVLATALSGLAAGLDTAITDFAAIITARASVT